MSNKPIIEPVLITLAQLRVVFGGVSRTWIYDQMRRDPNFPRPRKLNGFTNSWLTEEVRDYIDALPKHELTGLNGPDYRAAQSKKEKGDE